MCFSKSLETILNKSKKYIPPPPPQYDLSMLRKDSDISLCLPNIKTFQNQAILLN